MTSSPLTPDLSMLNGLMTTRALDDEPAQTVSDAEFEIEVEAEESENMELLNSFHCANGWMFTAETYIENEDDPEARHLEVVSMSIVSRLSQHGEALQAAVERLAIINAQGANMGENIMLQGMPLGDVIDAEGNLINFEELESPNEG